MKERTIITPVLIRQVQLMLAGGATGKEAAEITGTSEGTISRIKKAGFDYDTFVKNTEARRKPAEAPEEKREPEQLELQGGVDYQVKVNEELPGQIGMDLQPAEEKPEMSDQVKMMRLIAGQTDKICEKITAQALIINETLLQILRTLAQLDLKLPRISDYLGQILRKMDGR